MSCEVSASHWELYETGDKRRLVFVAVAGESCESSSL